MYNKRIAAIAALAAAALTVSACSGEGGDTQASQSSSAVTATSTPTAGAEAHNAADVTFAQGMIPHHQQAIEMSDMLLGKQDIDPRVVSLANEIKAAQGPEIEQLQGWLSQWGVSTPATTPGHDMPGMPSHDMPTSSMPGMPGHDMPGGDMPGMSGHGMMSAADMAALEAAQGTEASRLFLTQMIAHHEGAVTMAQQEVDGGQDPAAVALARAIIDTQQREITTMQGIVDSL
ncbi:DUF305 domain-containing protein [Mycolicibacterium sp. YH-1]|uniref:DUF305 domain-containing protein n=1 Tax=Mycolicibacterium sp. YH-1 TaxID=2908837 RepID=UPI001F4C1035|nr:DUF305 domain-containing protein [Mycolicibacterium sp. YH-1]UNB50899.1 DUF305 domain-containing protein [Mycolicibacterium sp. YH-1]